MFKSLLPVVLLLFTTPTFAQSINHEHISKYLGEEQRGIKSLSAEDINELQAGRGWGLAKAAELNGIPGPSHVLKMKEELHLTPQQVTKIQELFDQMKATAVVQGEKLIVLEQELGQSFKNKTIDQIKLRLLLEQIQDARTNLRFTHLSTHLHTHKILTTDQTKKYNHLRGYLISNH
ncbi:Spy/CpxP family protein refolding chaperone [Kiloniella sp.]|uniref:Spy/CpxP family protein refolding chaperone n=1 Tax=Kiloniella sp. TaxID=1938587 RepID=UPI003B019016